jgi:hypothetical protein
MSKIMICEINVETGKEIIREMTQLELEQHEIDKTNFQLNQEKERSKASAKADLLEKLGITEEEAKLLLS